MGKQLFTNRQMNFRLWLLGLRYIPILGKASPRVLELTDEKVIVEIKLRRATKNHLNSMYFGALAVGADTAAGIHAFALAEIMGVKLHFSFKSSKMEFHRRAESNVRFICLEGLKVKEAIKEAQEKNQRINLPVIVEAKDEQDELVATVEMTLSLRVK